MFPTRFTPLTITLIIGCLAVRGLALASTVEVASCVFSGHYQQTKELEGLREPLVSKGIVYYDCRHGVIWKTLEPVSQSLVLLNDGDSYRVDGEQAKKLSSRQSKMLGEIISAFIGDDIERLNKHFTISKKPLISDSDADHIIELIPKRKRLKRAFEMVTISTKGEKTQLIEMVDNNGLRTTISAQKDVIDESEISCRLLEDFNERECALLFKSKLIAP